MTTYTSKQFEDAVNSDDAKKTIVIVLVLLQRLVVALETNGQVKSLGPPPAKND